MQQATHTANPVRVNAAAILEVTEQLSGNLMLRLSDGRNYEADTSMTVRYRPVAGDYLVTQEDGYEYLNPKDVFERKYNAIGQDAAIEKEIQAKGLTAPRITPTDIDANIASEHYFTAADGVFGVATGEAVAAGESTVGWQSPPSLGLLTFCVLVLQNGFTVTGESACASPENFDAEIGRKIARQNAIQKVWPLMGYELRSKLSA